MRRALQLSGLAALLCIPRLYGAAQTNRPASVSGPEALEKLIRREEATLTNQLIVADRRAQATAESGNGLGTYMLIIAGLVTGVIVMRKVMPVLSTQASAGKSSTCEPASTVTVNPGAHEEAFAGYLQEFNADQSGRGAKDQSNTTRDVAKPAPEPQLVLPFEPMLVAHVNALDQVTTVRALFLDLNRTTDEKARQEILSDLLTAVRGLRKGLRVSAAYSVGQMASALEALLSKLTAQKESLSASAMRTLAGAIDLLPALCSPGVRSDLASNPVISLLAVDDDAVSRHALTCALKRFWARTDLANDGQEGLSLAQTRPYDLIFVDIEMPVMDGFELCSRIHSTALNPVTPVVFVTSHNDLPSRAKSSLAGGFEFLGKPFLGSELTAKALTLVLKRRLQLSLQPLITERAREQSIKAEPQIGAGNQSARQAATAAR
ncbi:MAG TPA: response regulator [Patescibacteria group bacterium]|nr:response regulator [Patescibacteria group bacterium]